MHYSQPVIYLTTEHSEKTIILLFLNKEPATREKVVGSMITQF